MHALGPVCCVFSAALSELQVGGMRDTYRRVKDLSQAGQVNDGRPCVALWRCRCSLRMYSRPHSQTNCFLMGTDISAMAELPADAALALQVRTTNSLTLVVRRMACRRPSFVG